MIPSREFEGQLPVFNPLTQSNWWEKLPVCDLIPFDQIEDTDQDKIAKEDLAGVVRSIKEDLAGVVRSIEGTRTSVWDSEGVHGFFEQLSPIPPRREGVYVFYKLSSPIPPRIEGVHGFFELSSPIPSSRE